MKQFLLDTCVLIDWADNPNRLREDARLEIGNGRNQVFVSAATAWEIAIKRKLGKLQIPTDLSWLMHENRFVELSISFAHAEATAQLPLHHGDPFDRLLIAQARMEKLTLISRDTGFRQYDVPILAA